VTGMAAIGSIVFLLAALFLASRGLHGVPPARLFRLALVWGVIIVGLVLLLRVLGV
jgi:hypothetical protein